MKNRIIAVMVNTIIVLTIVLPIMNTKVEAGEFITDEGTWKYKIEDNLKEITITGFNGYVNGSSAKLTVPCEINNLKVTKIGNYALSQNTFVSKVTIPDGITEIGNGAFEYCDHLSGVELPNGLLKIGENAFSHTVLGKVTIPSSVTSIGKEAFYSCKSLTRAIINGGDYIKENTFEGCYYLEEVEIGRNVNKISGLAFSQCNKLKKISLSEDSKYFSVDDGVLFNKDKTTLIVYPCGKNAWKYEIPTTVNTIDKYAFYKNENICNITIPDSVTSIKEYTFYDCTKLTAITIPKKLTELGSNAFSGCKSIISTIELPSTLKKINEGAFFYCQSITKVVIPNTIKSINESAFGGCKSLKEINIPEGITTIASSTFSGCSALERIEIPDGVTKIGEYAFSNCDKLDDVNIPEGVETIDDYAFYDTNVGSIILPNTVKSIGDYCFTNTNLYKITIPNSLTTIGAYALDGCKNLLSITIPESVTKIGEHSLRTNVDGELIVYGYKGSYVEGYASSYNYLTFKEIGEGQSITESEGAFTSVTKTFDNEKGYIYKDEYFGSDASEYNHHLATMSLCLAYSAYNTNPEMLESEAQYKVGNLDENIKELLISCGFKNYESYNYDAKPKMDDIACAMASKKISSEDTVIAIAVRGGGYEKEWGSNFNVGEDGNHYGFQSAADTVYDEIIKYINEKEISGHIKIWITGFSRAAATANLCAARLIDDGCGAWFGNVSFDAEKDIYAYCFATPAGADNANKPNSKKYKSIYNIVHYYDPVPLVAPAYWDMDRYGTTYILPYRETLSGASNYEKNMMKRLDKTQKEDYEKMSGVINSTVLGFSTKYVNIGSFLREAIKSLKYNFMFRNMKMYFPIHDREQFIGSGWKNKLRELFDTLYSNDEDSKEPLDIILNMRNELIPATFTYAGIIDTAVTNKDYIALVHAEQDYYLSWMQSMDSNYVSGANYKFSNGTGRLLYVNCPVDVYVYDNSNNLVASIVNEEPYSGEILAFIDENEQKVVYLPHDEDYKILVKPREDCKTTITIDEYAGVSSEITKIISYSDIEAKKDEEIEVAATQYNTEVSEDNNFKSGAIYLLKIGEEVINPSIEVLRDSIMDYTYLVDVNCDEEEGDAVGGGLFNIGEFCEIMAQRKTGYVFDGWYVDDIKVSEDSTYRFAVKESAEFEAKFNKCEHNNDNHEILGVQKADLENDGFITYKCSDCEEEYSQNIYRLESVELKESEFTYDGNEKRPTFIVMDRNGNAIDDSNYDIEYSKDITSVGKHTAKLIFKDDSNYAGKVERDFEIKNEQNPEEDDKVQYEIVSISNKEYIKNKSDDIIVTVNGDISKFYEVTIDDNKLSNSNYTVVSGSTIVTLKKDFLNTLNDGEHKLTFLYNDGEVSTILKIASLDEDNSEEKIEKNENTDRTKGDDEAEKVSTKVNSENHKKETGKSKNVNTGDNIMIWSGLFILSVIAIVLIARFRKK